MWLHICIYTSYIHVYIYIHTHIYTHIYIYNNFILVTIPCTCGIIVTIWGTDGNLVRTFLIKICLELNKNLCSVYTGEFKDMLAKTSVQLNKEKVSRSTSPYSFSGSGWLASSIKSSSQCYLFYYFLAICEAKLAQVGAIIPVVCGLLIFGTFACAYSKSSNIWSVVHSQLNCSQLPSTI